MKPFINIKKSINLTEKPYSFLEHSINICMVDDDPDVLELYAGILKYYPLYTIFSCSNASKANLMLSSNKRFHVCIMDLGLDEINNDEFYLLKKYSARTSFVILTGNNSINKGFQCGRHGSFSVFEKPIDFEKIEFINAINHAFIYSLVNYSNSKYHKPVSEKIIEAFLFYNPVDITEWAFKANVTEQYLRRVWNTIYGYQPKYFLWLYKLMTSAFSFYNSEFLVKNGVINVLPVSLLKYNEKENLAAEKYFKCNKCIFNTILN